MSFDQRTNRKKSFNSVRGIMGISMGLIYVIIAVLVIYFQRAGQLNIGATISYIIAGLMAGYGIFRVYRGYKQMTGEGY